MCLIIINNFSINKIAHDNERLFEKQVGNPRFLLLENLNAVAYKFVADCDGIL